MEINEEEKLKHVAVMMDGNGRWAKTKNRPRSFGHIEGGKVLKNIIKAAYELNIKYFTVFAFSTENWKRPKEEVDNLMSILSRYLKNDIKYAVKNNIKIRILGDYNKLSDDLQSGIKNAMKETENCSGLNFQIAINYGGRDDLLRAFKKIHKEIINKRIDLEDVNEDIISSHLDTFEIPEPDLFIRTGGEKRLSNFLLWQFAYTEFVFTDTLWPDFTKEEFIQMIEIFKKRDRRFGKVK